MPTAVSTTVSPELTPVTFTPVEEIPKIVDQVRQGFATGITKSVQWRKQQLLALYQMVQDEENAICEASRLDLGRCPAETVMVDVMVMKNEVVEAIEKLDEWTKPERVYPGILNATDRCEIRREAYGVSLIIGAWNYAVQLTLGPLVASIAAGNACIVKPSEVAPYTAAVMTSMIERYLDNRVIRVINGGVKETSRLLEQQMDHICYTGNGAVGKIVMQAASRHLTPVILELGGKSPCIIDESADMKLVAKRIMWAKLVNCGQTCIAPDYVMVKKSVRTKFVAECARAVEELYGSDARTSPYYARIVAERHLDRLTGALEGQIKAGGIVAIGGKSDRESRFLEPTVVTDVGKDPESNPLMKDELFGPILPVVDIDSIDEAINYVRSRDKPLALYVFSKSQTVIDKVLANTDSGSVLANDLFMNMAIHELPFGGVGPSGMGKYHGHHGFLAFSHQRAAMLRPHGMEIMNEPRYPAIAYTARGRKMLGFLLERRIRGRFGNLLAIISRLIPWTAVSWLACAAIGVVIGWFARARSI
ncbi:Aldehyde/histidinol dehydrogenase [Phlyctochytrium arcticum]|nr:Aldehyde/histidinol dehydrogenase [Phlyctochytrium arcticum]